MPITPIPVSQDGAVIEGPLLYKGGNLLATAGGPSEVIVFDGLSASGDYLDDLQALASGHDVHFCDDGIYVLRGLFIDIGANVRFFTVYVDYDVPDANTGTRAGG